jgi:hypothetical protein
VKTSYPLEGETRVEAIGVHIYDGYARKVYGVLRIRRNANPDHLVLEVKPKGSSEFQPFLELTAINNRLAVRNHGIKSLSEGEKADVRILGPDGSPTTEGG